MINLDGIGLFLTFLAVYALVILALAGLALVWLIRGGQRRWAGAGLLLTLSVYGFGPTLLADYRGDRLGARLQAASFWPEHLSFAGANILILRQSSFGCDALCDALMTRAGIAALYQGNLDNGTHTITAEDLRGGIPDVTRVFNFGGEVGDAQVRGAAAELPELIDWIIVIDEDGRYTRANPGMIALSQTDADRIAKALHIYHIPDERIDSPPAPQPVARMFAGQRTKIPYFMPLVADMMYSNDTTGFSDALETWICGPVDMAVTWDDRCPYLF